MATKPAKRVEFRAPPPSPIAAFKIGLENEESLDEFLRRSLRVPELVLPCHLFPREEFGGDPPEIDFAALAASEDGSVSELLRSAEVKGCFQLVNHGVPKEMVGAIREAMTEFFNLPSEQKSVLSRTPASRSGYEEFSGDVAPITEELFWRGDEKKIMSPAMRSVWPQGSHGFKNFRRQLKRLSKETEGIASKILQILHERGSRKRVPSGPPPPAVEEEEEEEATACPVFCFYFESLDGQQPQGDHFHTDVLRLLIRRSELFHSLCLNFPCDSSEFRVYSKKGWTSFMPNKEAIIFTIGDQTQKWSKGQYKHVVGRSMSSRKVQDHNGGQVSVALLYSPPPRRPPPHSLDSHASDHHEQPCERTFTVKQQIRIVLYLILFCHLLNFIKQFT